MIGVRAKKRIERKTRNEFQSHINLSWLDFFITQSNNIIKKMDELDDPNTIFMIVMVMMLLLNLIFSNEMFVYFWACCAHSARITVYVIPHGLGKKSKNHFGMRDMNFWKMYDKLKDETSNEYSGASSTSRKTRSKTFRTLNGLTCLPLRLGTALRHYAKGIL